MNASIQFATYIAILRKHLVLLLVSAGLVVAAGVAYLSQQVPVYEASATLLVSMPVRSAMGARDVGDPFAISRQKLNTEMYLLRDDKELANSVIAKLGQDGVDVAAGGYTDASLRSSVRVDFVSGTDLVGFSLTGPDAATLPQACNAYAAAYKRKAERESQASYKVQVSHFEEAVKRTKTAVDAAEGALSTFRREHSEVDWVLRENAYSARARSLEQMLPKLQDERRSAATSRQVILAALERSGVEALERDGVYDLVMNSDAGDALSDALVRDEVIVALPFVETNAEVVRLLDEERAAARRDRELELRGDKPESGARVAARDEETQARRGRGRKIVQILRKQLVDYDDLDRRVEALEASQAEVREQEMEMNRVLARFDDLGEARDRAQRDYDEAKGRLVDFTSVYVKETGQDDDDLGLRIEIRTAAESARQIAPQKGVILGLTAFAAIAISLGLVLLFEYLDDTIKSKEDFDRYVGLPFLGFVPHIDDADSDNRDLAADAKPGTPIAESFRAIRTSLLFSRGGAAVRTILVTSAGPGEGKTTVSTNLAATLAKNKGPVLLIDADLRRPRVAKALGLENSKGLTNCLIGEASLDDVVMPTRVEGLFVLSSGPIPPNPAELLHGERMAALLTEAREKYDRVVIDSPPVVAVTDARVLASQVDGLYVVISMGKTSRRVIHRALDSITSIGFEVHGAILNNLHSPTGRYGYYYYRDYAYGKGYYRSDAAGGGAKPS